MTPEVYFDAEAGQWACKRTLGRHITVRFWKDDPPGYSSPCRTWMSGEQKAREDAKNTGFTGGCHESV